MNENKLVLGTGVKVWSIICIIASTFTAFINLASGAYDLAIIGIGCVIAYAWLLISKKRLAFYLIVILIILILVLNIVEYKISLYASLSGLLNPIITYALLSKYWKQMN